MAKAKKRKTKVKKSKRAAARRPKAKTKRPVKKPVRKTKAVKFSARKPAAMNLAIRFFTAGKSSE